MQCLPVDLEIAFKPPEVLAAEAEAEAQAAEEARVRAEAKAAARAERKRKKEEEMHPAIVVSNLSFGFQVAIPLMTSLSYTCRHPTHDLSLLYMLPSHS